MQQFLANAIAKVKHVWILRARVPRNPPLFGPTSILPTVAVDVLHHRDAASGGHVAAQQFHTKVHNYNSEVTKSDHSIFTSGASMPLFSGGHHNHSCIPRNSEPLPSSSGKKHRLPDGVRKISYDAATNTNLSLEADDRRINQDDYGKCLDLLDLNHGAKWAFAGADNQHFNNADNAGNPFAFMLDEKKCRICGWYAVNNCTICQNPLSGANQHEDSEDLKS